MPIVPSDEPYDDDVLGIRLTPARFERAYSRAPVDICLLYATDVEEDAVDRLFRRAHADVRPYPPSYRRFYRAKLAHRSRLFKAVGCKSTAQGSLSMLSALQDVYRHFQPSVTCLVGIAGAIDPSLSIGDVVVAKRTYWYERGRDEGDVVSREIIPFSLNATMTHLVDAAVADMRRRRNDFKIVLAPYGTGDKVVASELSSVRKYLTTVDRKIAAVEMESGGFFQYFDGASFRSPEDMWLVVKGISDHADRSKGDADQALAAANSVKAGVALAAQLILQRNRAASR